MDLVKGSLIETYKREKKLPAIHISLAHFEREEETDQDNIINNSRRENY